MRDVIHLIRAGDTLTRIAEHYRTSVNALIHTNNLKEPNRLRVGQLLRVQVESAFSATAVKVTSVSSTSPDSKQKSRPLLVKKLKLIDPPQRGDKKTIACCGWASIQVETYFPAATLEDKKRTRWLIRDEKTRASLFNPGRTEADFLYIDSFPNSSILQ
jgi:murein DD-endopeptidase MepM/ murein hydrolase activator NlpD